MKPTNPMAQLQQWKANNGLKIEPVKSAVKNSANLKFEETLKPQQEAQGEAKRQYKGKLSLNPLAFEYAQLSRQFKLIHDSNRKCLEVYPDDFHHKLKMREECVDLVERLKGGGKLFNELAKAANLTQEQTALLKDFNLLNGYLIFKFSEVAKQIEALNVERVENMKLQGGNDGSE